MSTPASDIKPNPSHTLWVELSTRITTRRLHFRSGDEETAVASVHSLFKLTRELMTANPSDELFLKIAGKMLNETIRPYTARWHGWLTPDTKRKDSDGLPAMKFRDPQVRREFRGELQELQPYLRGYSKAFDLLRQGIEKDSDGRTPYDWTSHQEDILLILKRELKNDEKPVKLGAPVKLGIQPQVNIYSEYDGALSASEIEEREFEFLRERRRRRGIEIQNTEPLFNGMGLALSGGGIKSATFCLGVVQELAKRGILQQMDYLSTVSGGGYLGTFVSSYLGSKVGETLGPAHTDASRIREAFEPEPSGREAAPVRHLRNSSKYLLNGGLWGKLNIGGLLASGALTNIMMVLPIPLFVACGLALLQWLGYWTKCGNASSPGLMIFWCMAILTGAVWLLLSVIQRCTHRAKPEDKSSKFRSIWEVITLGLALATIVTGLAYFFPKLLYAYLHIRDWLHGHIDKLVGFSPSEFQVSTLTGAVSVLLGAGGFLIKNTRLRSFAIQLFILSGPLLYLLVIFYVTGKIFVTSEKNNSEWSALHVFGITLVWFVWSMFLVNINMLAMHRYYRSRLCECYLVKLGSPQATWWTKLVGKIWRGYDPTANNDLGPALSVKLSSIGESMVVPYHLINAFINLPASKSRALRGRAGDFYLFSRDVCGSPYTGYVKTTDLEAAEPRLDLGTAMAISGAAAHTNMGWRSMKNFRFLMALFNVRLGYWVPNLKIWNKPSKAQWLKKWTVGLPYLLAEMGGRIQENMNFLNLSDGGHIENLGAYELLRRKCKFIISVDGGGNKDITGGDLQRLERYASIDFGIEMEYDLSELQADDDGTSRTQAILVKILYPMLNPSSQKNSKSEKEIGWMIYLRPGITGVEPNYLLDHWRTNPLFPFESLIEQFFSEEQFEGYRCLGQKAAESLFQENLGTDYKLQVEELFKQVGTHFLVDNDDAFTKTPLSLDSENMKSTSSAT